MISIPELLIGAAVGYVLCAVAVGRYIANRVSYAIDMHIAAATYLFVNEQTKETTRIQLELEDSD